MPVPEPFIPGMGLYQLFVVYFAGELLAIHAIIQLFLFITADPDLASPLASSFLILFVRGTAKAGFLIRWTGTAPYAAGSKIRKYPSIHNP